MDLAFPGVDFVHPGTGTTAKSRKPPKQARNFIFRGNWNFFAHATSTPTPCAAQRSKKLKIAV
jgi:hypothetical protein